MVRLISTWLLIPLAAAALFVGCGSSSGKSTSAGSSTSSTSSTAPKLPAVASAVAACKQNTQRLPSLPPSTRTRLEQICDRAASGDKEAVRKAAIEGCRALVNVAPLPSEAARQHALAACRQAGGSK